VRITIVGGGPAGLYFGLLMKKQDARHEVRVFERDAPGDTYGWGIVFSDRTLSFLRESDGPSYEAVARLLTHWDNVDVVHRGERVRVRGNRFAGVARVAFLDVLRQRARELGVELFHRQTVTSLGALPASDLLVGADGAGSPVRQAHAEAFRPRLDVGRNKYIWLGTRRAFEGLTLTFRQSDAGLFVAHSYRFDREASTFIVEAVGEAWARAGFERMSIAETCGSLARVFADDLRGEPLLAKDSARWQSFTIVRNQRWHVGHVTLLGDALHTAHFSIGSGTKAAIEDAIALAACFASSEDVPAALAAFERTRKPVVEALQDAAQASLAFFEDAEARMRLEPVELAYEIMTRSGRIDHEKLRQRDPEFVAAWEAEGRRTPPARGGG
jgi:anthraniloyl-CoA monooxygenase